MRKILFSTLLSLLLPMTASAYDAEINGIYYNFSGYEATVTYKNTSYNSYSGAIAIPSSVTTDSGKKYSVTAIGEQAFYSCKGLTSVIIPNSVISIGTRAFNNCQKLTTVDLGDKLTSMGDYAFQDCQLLESINIPGTLKLIPEEAFENCFALASVTLNEGIEEIGNGAFYDTDALTEITIPASVKKIGRAPFWSHGNHAMKRMIIADSDTPLEFTNVTEGYNYGNDYLTDDITLDYFYLGRDINRVKTEEPLVYNTKELGIGPKVTAIGDNAFYNCSELTTVTFPEGSNLKSIGTKAFNNCLKMTSFNLGNKLASMGDYAFRNCQLLGSITIPGSLKIIPFEAFENCYALSSVTLCEGVEEICNGTFNNTKALTEITIPASIKKIGRASFYCGGSQAMKRMIIADSDTPLEFTNVTEGYSYGNDYLTDEITLDYFYLGRDINRVKTGNPLVYNTKELGIGPKVTAIDDNAFLNCSELTTVTFPGGSYLKSIGADSFNNCKKMTSFNLGDKLTSMGEHSFRDCQLLESITIPGTLKLIPEEAFERCYALVSVTLGDGIEEISNGAFYNTIALTEITIPASVKKIGRAPFYGSHAMKRMILADSDTPLEFTNVTEGYSYGNDYLTDNITLDYFYLGRDINRVGTSNPLIYNTTELGIGPKVTIINDNTFKNCSELTTVTFPGGSHLKSIGKQAFNNCSKMTSFNLGEELTSMGDYAFQDCQLLESITIPGTLKIIPEEAFENCFALASVTLCDGIEEIGNGAFYDTDALTEIIIPASVKKINRAPFYCNGDHAMKRMIIVDSDTPIEFANNATNDYSWGQDYLTDNITLDYFYLGRDINRVKTDYSLVYKTKELEIGPKVTTISDDPNGLFYRTEEITSVKSRNLNPFHINDDDFYEAQGIYDNATLWIPYGTRQAYIDANWKFKNIQYLSFLVVGTATNGGTLKFAGESVTNGTKSVLVDRETDVSFEVIPASNYDFTSLTVDGEPVNVENGCYIYPNLLSNIDVVATFTEKPKFNITAKATGGTVSLNGKTPSASQSIKVYRDTDVTLTVAAAEGYEKPKVTVNGTDVSAQLQNNKLILQNIQEAKTIVVTFTKKKFQIKNEAVLNGTIELSKTVVEWGDSFTATFKPATGYEFATATVNGKDVTANVVNDVLTVTNVKENKTVGGSFKKQTFSVTVNGHGVSVSNTRPEYGDNVTVTIDDDPDRTLVSLLVNGEDVTAQVVNGQYVITNVKGNVTVEATFKSSKEFINMTSEYAMFSCPEDLDFTDSELSAYIASGFNKATNQVLLVRVYDVPAGTGIFLIGTPGTTYKIPYSETSSYYVNLFRANLEENTIYATAGNFSNYIFGNQDGEPGFNPIANKVMLPKQTAYLQLPSSFVTAGVKVSVVFEEDIIDGIEDFRISDTDETIYDLAGRRLSKTRRGINIVNGKKTLR